MVSTWTMDSWQDGRNKLAGTHKPSLPSYHAQTALLAEPQLQLPTPEPAAFCTSAAGATACSEGPSLVSSKQPGEDLRARQPTV